MVFFRPIYAEIRVMLCSPFISYVYSNDSQPFLAMDHLFKKYPMDHFAMLTPHRQLIETVAQRSVNSSACSIPVHNKIIKALWNALWTTRNSRLRIISTGTMFYWQKWNWGVPPLTPPNLWNKSMQKLIYILLSLGFSSRVILDWCTFCRLMAKSAKLCILKLKLPLIWGKNQQKNVIKLRFDFGSQYFKKYGCLCIETS